MAAVSTIQVRWPAKFGQRVVTINAADFDAALHNLVEDEPAPITVDLGGVSEAAPVDVSATPIVPELPETPTPKKRRGY